MRTWQSTQFWHKDSPLQWKEHLLRRTRSKKRAKWMILTLPMPLTRIVSILLADWTFENVCFSTSLTQSLETLLLKLACSAAQRTKKSTRRLYGSFDMPIARHGIGASAWTTSGRVDFRKTQHSSSPSSYSLYAERYQKANLQLGTTVFTWTVNAHSRIVYHSHWNVENFSGADSCCTHASTTCKILAERSDRNLHLKMQKEYKKRQQCLVEGFT